MGSETRCVEHGVLYLDSKKEITSRLYLIYQKVKELLDKYNPTELAVEKIFFAKNVQSMIRLGEARGATIVAALNKGLSVSEYSPLEVKKAIVGYGGASKEQVGKMVTLLLKLKEPPEEDAADALAIALCHERISRFRKRVLNL